MTIVQLKYAIAVAEYKNFTIAADKCFVTQPTLSMQIQKLESELDVIIFDRGKKPIGLTEVGEKIIKQSKLASFLICNREMIRFYKKNFTKPWRKNQQRRNRITY